MALSACDDQPEGTITELPTSTPATPSTDATGSTATSRPPGTPRATGPSATATVPPAKVGTASDPVLRGTRQVVIVPIPSFESILALDERGRLNLTDGDPAFRLFVFTPVKGGHLITTTETDRNGDPACLRVQASGSNPLTVVAAPCDVSDASQLFTVRAADPDSQGGPTYAISNQSAFLRVSSDGELIAEELGDAPLTTTFSLVDNGRATALPGD